jgi:hypothetical protein
MKKMKAKLAALAALPREERRLLRQTWLSFLLADVGLRLFSLSNVQQLLAWRFRLLPEAGAGAVPPAGLERLVDLAARHHIRPMGCLHRSLVLQALLQWQGLETDLRIGVRKQQGMLQAHAWLEQSGQLLFEPPETRDRFTPLLRSGEAG